MQIAYLVLAHQQPKQVKRLVAALASKDCSFYIHVDKNVDITPFQSELSSFEQVHLLQKHHREAGTWGDFGLVKGILQALRQIKRKEEPGYVILVSGQDYPLRSNKDIRSFLTENYGTCFITCLPIPQSEWGARAVNRLNRYKITLSNKRFHFVLLPSIVEREFYRFKTAKNLLLSIFYHRFDAIYKIFQRRRFPSNLTPYGGDTWWALPNDIVQKILDFVDREPGYCSYHVDSLLADEIFFQSILMKIIQSDERLVRPTLMYTNWSRKGVPLPVTFTMSDFGELKAAAHKKLFARKFDSGVDARILDQLDELRCS